MSEQQLQNGHSTRLRRVALGGRAGIVLSGIAMVTCLVSAESAFQMLHEFFPAEGVGSVPACRLVQGDDGAFYGTMMFGGAYGCGSVFKYGPGGVLTNLFSFNGTNGCTPRGGLTFGNDGNLYGVTYYGGSNYSGPNTGFGTIFRITTQGVLTTLVYFQRTNGAGPASPLSLGTDGDFYGTTADGLNGLVIVFKVTTNGSLTILHKFDGAADGTMPSDSGLVQASDGNFYGSAYYGGIGWPYIPNGNGTLYRISPDGAFTTLVYFNGTNGVGPSCLTMASDGNLYGTTAGGGALGLGTMFRVTTNGALTTLFSFNGTNGSRPYSGVMEGPDGSFYGTTGMRTGPPTSFGTIFGVTTNGSLTTVLHLDGTNGITPHAELIRGLDGNLYGAMADGNWQQTANSNVGSIFRLVEPPSIAIVKTQGNVVLSWCAFPNGLFRVEHTSSPAQTGWTIIFPQVTATGNVASVVAPADEVAQRFYRVVLLP